MCAFCTLLDLFDDGWGSFCPLRLLHSVLFLKVLVLVGWLITARPRNQTRNTLQYCIYGVALDYVVQQILFVVILRSPAIPFLDRRCGCGVWACCRRLEASKYIRESCSRSIVCGSFDLGLLCFVRYCWYRGISRKVSAEYSNNTNSQNLPGRAWLAFGIFQFHLSRQSMPINIKLRLLYLLSSTRTSRRCAPSAFYRRTCWVHSALVVIVWKF